MKKSQIYKKNDSLFRSKNYGKYNKLETVEFDQIENGICLAESNLPIYQFYNKANKKMRKFRVHQRANLIHSSIINESEGKSEPKTITNKRINNSSIIKLKVRNITSAKGNKTKRIIGNSSSI